MASESSDRLSISLLTRDYPPSIYGGAGVHVAQLVPQLRKLIDVDVQCMGEPREGATAHSENYPPGANAALRVFGADLSMAAAVPDVDLVHSHTWYANLAGHLVGLLKDIPHVVTAHSLSRLYRCGGRPPDPRGEGRGRPPHPRSEGRAISRRSPPWRDRAAFALLSR